MELFSKSVASDLDSDVSRMLRKPLLGIDDVSRGTDEVSRFSFTEPFDFFDGLSGPSSPSLCTDSDRFSKASLT